jgi:glutaconate CoA-transferase subunit B
MAEIVSVDRQANLSSTVIGDYAQPPTRLPAVGRAPEIATGSEEVVVIAPHSRRTFVERLDFLSTTRARTTRVMSELGELGPMGSELTLTAVHPRVGVEQVSAATDEKLLALRGLISRG